jgi:hypothetical protein
MTSAIMEIKMKKWLVIPAIVCCAILMMGSSECVDSRVTSNNTALDEQAQTESNQRVLFEKQPPPRLTWSLERDNLIKRFRLQNDRAVNFYMYVFIEGWPDPVGYYMINKVSSVDSQLTNTEQIVEARGHAHDEMLTLPSPAEDGSYGTNGNGVFGFTPEEIYLQTNMHYIVSTVPLQFAHPVMRLAVINSDEARKMLAISKSAMSESGKGKIEP